MEKDKSKNGEIANRISSLIEEALSLADGIEENASPEEELTPYLSTRSVTSLRRT